MTKHHDSGVSTMTWLSRLLPQSPSLQRLADHNHGHRARQGRRRRRMANLETLENRTLLSNVTAYLATGTLTITGDTHNDEFSVTENDNGTVTARGPPRPLAESSSASAQYDPDQRSPRRHAVHDQPSGHVDRDDPPGQLRRHRLCLHDGPRDGQWDAHGRHHYCARRRSTTAPNTVEGTASPSP